jgi:DNA-binding NarL/FixJ family response regulator
MPPRSPIRHPEFVSAPRTVLIVDDNSALSSTLAAYLARVGHWDAVLTAPDAMTGLHLAAQQRPTAIVLDNRMPDRDGIDVLCELRSACPDARIVMHTTEDTSLLRERARELGADGFVAKGRPLDELASQLVDQAA